MNMERPQKVRDAQIQGDNAALSRMARKGGIESGKSRREAKLKKEEREEALDAKRREDSEAERENTLRATNEDVLSVEGDDVSENRDLH